jgi:hypothetical protein
MQVLISTGFAILASLLIGSSIYLEIGEYTLPIIFGLFLLLLLDFITLGYLKTTKVGRFLYPLLFILYSFSLSFIYKDVYYTLISNLKKWKLIVGFIIFIASSLFVGFINVSEAMRWDITLVDTRYEQYKPNIYDDERKPYSSRPASISSYYQSNNVIRLFLFGHYYDIENALDNNTLIIKVNKQRIIPYRIQNHTTEEMQSGYLLFMDISKFPNGSEYEIEISASESDKKITIPFYKG